MAKGSYFGVGSKARKIKTMYFGVDNVARKVKKAYIGVGGKARVWWSGFPEEPTEYTLINTYSSSTTFTAPEDGWYQIELFGRSGAGGKGAYYVGSDIQDSSVAGGGGGGGGAYCCSNKIKLNKGDTITIVIGTTCTVTITATTGETYSVMKCTTGANGGAGSAASSSATGGSGGNGGTASGGNVSNISGGSGGKGSTKTSPVQDPSYNRIWSASGGSGGSAAKSGGRSGGAGGRGYLKRTLDNGWGTKTAANGDSAQAGFCKIYRGNTNIVA